jgi:hypothetical protein
MKRLIELDPLFLDPYLVVAGILMAEGKGGEAKALLKDAYERSMRMIVDKDGNWPKKDELELV